MYQVKKRDGKIVDFNIAKITDAIIQAFEAQNTQYHPNVIDFLSLKVTADFESKIKDGYIQLKISRTQLSQFLFRQVMRISQRHTFFTERTVRKSVT